MFWPVRFVSVVMLSSLLRVSLKMFDTLSCCWLSSDNLRSIRRTSCFRYTAELAKKRWVASWLPKTDLWSESWETLFVTRSFSSSGDSLMGLPGPLPNILRAYPWILSLSCSSGFLVRELIRASTSAASFSYLLIINSKLISKDRSTTERKKSMTIDHKKWIYHSVSGSSKTYSDSSLSCKKVLIRLSSSRLYWYH